MPNYGSATTEFEDATEGPAEAKAPETFDQELDRFAEEYPAIASMVRKAGKFFPG